MDELIASSVKSVMEDKKVKDETMQFTPIDIDIMSDCEEYYNVNFDFRYNEWKTDPIKYVNFVEEQFNNDHEIGDIVNINIYVEEFGYAIDLKAEHLTRFFRMLRNVKIEEIENEDQFVVKMNDIVNDNYALLYNLHHVSTALYDEDMNCSVLKEFESVQQKVLHELNKKFDDLFPIQ